MKKLLFLYFMMLFNTLVCSQETTKKIKIEEKRFLANLSFNITNPIGIRLTSENSRFFRNGLQGDNQGTDFLLSFGYQYGKSTFETGIGTLTSSIGGVFDYTGEWNDVSTQTGFLNQTSLFIIPLRYYYEVIKINKIWLQLGGGIINCLIPYDDFLNSLTNFGKEERLKSYALSGELSAKIGYLFTENWSFSLNGYYLVGSPNIRRLDFNKTTSITSIYTNANAYSIGLNLQYKF